MAPDGKHVAVSTDDGREANVWIVDVTGTMSITRLTYVGRNRFPVWSSDGQRVAFQSDRDGDLGIFAQRIDGTGTPERLTRADASTSHRPESWGPKDQHLLFTIAKDIQFELHALSLADRRTTPVGGIKSAAPVGAVFSPDGRWIAYAVSESDIGHSVAYVEPFPATGARHQISRDDDGHHPVWSTDNHRLFYVPRPQRMAMVEITTTPRFVFTPPRELPPAGLMGPPMAVRGFDILPDGRFVGTVPVGWNAQAAPPLTVHVVLNWFDELRSIRF